MLFDEWLTNLRKQGDVEVLDPALQSTSAQDHSASRPTGQHTNRRPERRREGKTMSEPEIPVPAQEESPEQPRPSRLRRFFLRHVPLTLAGLMVVVALVTVASTSG